MGQPGGRYRELATRCRASALRASTAPARAALMRMADGYDARAAALEAMADCSPEIPFLLSDACSARPLEQVEPA